MMFLGYENEGETNHCDRFGAVCEGVGARRFFCGPRRSSSPKGRYARAAESSMVMAAM